jgi:lipopolysaccharide transport system ATP-binding protein
MYSEPPSIRTEGLGKTFRLFPSSRDRLKELLLFGTKTFHQEFTALQGLSFTLERGRTLGLIGRNGSGKSTLLQLLAGILRPTTGTVHVEGRVSALLELGAGFNPEFTGMENLHFQGALLGLSRAEMDARVDEIVAFADLGEFIDRPVRTYSSGMFVRLAFALATSVDADVILVDEALAVGDLAFQSKCFKRIRDLKEKGTTFVLVSHSSSHILNHADCAMLLENGKMVMFDSDVHAVVAAYETALRNSASLDDGRSRSHPSAPMIRSFSHDELREVAAAHVRRDLHESRFGTAEAVIHHVDFSQGPVGESASLQPGRETVMRFRIASSRAFDEVVLGFSFRQAGTGDLWGDNNLLAEFPLKLLLGENVIDYTFNFPLASGEYLVHCGLAAFEAGRRIELDQRWPIEQLTVIASRTQLGHVWAPITVQIRT